MTNRTKRVLYIFAFSIVLGVPGCSYNKQSKFQSAFLPSTPPPAAEAEAAEPPALEPNPYLHDAPPILVQKLPVAPSEGDLLMQHADQAFLRGKKAYQANDAQQARREFDTAVDLMLEASANNPSDRQAFEARLDEMVDAVHRYDLAGLGAGVDVDEARFEKAPLEDILQMTFPVDPKLKDKVKEQVQATASQLPLSVNDAVLGYINYFSGRGRKTLIAGLERAGRYRPLIERILQEEGIPQELIHLAQAESGFFPRAISYKAAGGMWQFVAWRGQEYGLMRTAYTDDRFDPEKATRASARHLHDLYNMFGDWYLAMAAYNCGPNAVAHAVERTGYADFWELRSRHALPEQTTNYVPIILAMTIMTKNAAQYGLEGVVPDAPLEYDTIVVDAPTHLGLVADLTDAPIPELQDLNPALLKGVAPAGYVLHVPKGTGGTLSASLQMIPAERRAAWRMHKVASGETLASIGRNYGMAGGNIAAANGLKQASPAAGDRLLIPVAYRESTAPKRAVAAKRHVTKAQRKRLPVITHTAANRASRIAGE
ncbi:MAG TPA: transglycosylase SLT domain-containing protein [Bryobacteraceae bacterium]|nr:transglycosylase SLT domain-containing protein [Bryobacteraceae bacterium]